MRYVPRGHLHLRPRLLEGVGAPEWQPTPHRGFHGGGSEVPDPLRRCDTCAVRSLKIVAGAAGGDRAAGPCQLYLNVAAIGKETETRTISLSRALCCEFLCTVYI